MEEGKISPITPHKCPPAKKDPKSQGAEPGPSEAEAEEPAVAARAVAGADGAREAGAYFFQGLKALRV